MPKGSKHYHAKGRKVIDGTPCYNDGSSDICIEAKCVQLPCDKILGSDAKVDKCGVCGGDNSACRVVSGVTQQEIYVTGYNDILIIPSDAVGIVIEEVTPNKNYFAIRDFTGSYHLNGNFEISYSGDYIVGGTTFHYQRNYDLSTPERLWSEGPTLEPLFISLIYNDPVRSPDIRYEYAVVDKEVKPPAEYSWKTEEYEECSKTCSGGEQQRPVYCVRSSDHAKVEDSLCDILTKPEQSRECNTHPCPALWHVGEWSQCSQSCASGVQFRLVYCEQLIQGGILAVTNDKQCEQDDTKDKPTFFQTCNEGVECPRWHAGPWTACNRICGPGNQTREVTCEKGKHETIVLENSFCDAEKMPSTIRNCTVRPCEGLEWILTEWSGCTDKCGPQRESREAYCANEKGEVFPDDLCSDKPIPQLSRPCPKVKPCKALWHTSEWSRCSAKCGTGVQTRVVFCGVWKGDSVRKVADAQCKKEKKFTTVRNCTRVPCKGSWFSGPWTKCSVSCGGGERTRKLLCLHGENVVTASQCDPSTIPYSNETCNKHPCVEDVTTEAPVDCSTSPYGCCPDGKTIAAPNIECPAEDCGPFGCCLDMKTPAKGPFKAGCPEITLCSETKYGCCPDGLTAATGENNQGCFFDVTTQTPAERTTLTETSISPITSVRESSSTAATDKIATLSSAAITTLLSTETTVTSTTSSAKETKSSITMMTTTSGVEVSTTESPVTTSSVTDTTLISAATTTAEATTVAETSSISEVTMTKEKTETISSETSSATESSSALTGTVTSSVLPEATVMSTTTGTMTTSTLPKATVASTTTGTMTTSTLPETTVLSSITGTMTTSTLPKTTVVSSATGTMTTSTLPETTVASTTTGTMTISTSPETTVASITTGTMTSSTLPETTVASTATGTMTTSTLSEITTASATTRTVTTSTLPETTVGSTTTGTIPSVGTTTLSSDSVATSHTGASTSSSVVTTGITGSLDTSSDTVGTLSDTVPSLTTDTLSTKDSEPTTDFMTTSSITGTRTTIDETETAFTTLSDSTASTTTETLPSSTTGTAETTTLLGSQTSATETSSSFSTVETSPPSSKATQSVETSDTVTTGTGSVSTSSQSDSSSSSTSEITLSGTDSTMGSTLSISSTSDATPVTSTLLSDKSITDITSTTVLSTSTEITQSDNTTESLSSTTIDFQNVTSTMPVSCHDTEFGCCPDNITASTSESSNCFDDGVLVDKLENITQAEEPDGDICGNNDYHNGSSVCCESSQYGCCPDNVTAATGEGYKGCFKLTPHELQKIECEKSTYGCCPDGVTPALDDNYLGCPCQTFEYGCCNDSVTPRLGPDDEGCCFSSEFGCCPDNKTKAEREDFVGCSCSTLPNGCCRDNILPAIGPNQEGCECQFSAYGCCEDEFTMPTGPDFEGCLCHEMLYGCCPDNFTAMRGSLGEGCRCDESRHGCCPGGQAAAKGPEYFGCPCSTLQFGCCPDGKTPAHDKEKSSCPCNTTEYGCCPNGIMHATGPDHAGCPCETTKFGCCADGKTAAVGFYGAGCEDCAKLVYGCCPDNKTVAKGKNYDGCPCSTYPYGCCSDGQTPAQGPNSYGCSCGLYGCCHDGRTPAKGPNYYGCPCGQYGCCPDGTLAKGPNYYGCSCGLYGCCRDGITPAEGPNYYGCPCGQYGCCPDGTLAKGPNNYGCSCGQYGCCPDGITPAIGPNGTGCACETYPFGCCHDNKTAAMGPNYLGCSCKTMAYGCCSDGITPATGPNSAGCSCESSLYGCCPDNLTPAKGRSFSGCPCNSFKYGCCPDNRTVATGPNNAGCSCRTMEHGCCYDGITPAKGPYYEGCPCNISEYGCCPDGKTAALGVNYKGCSCINTEFGCCSDGYTAASGPNNEGCSTVPTDINATGQCNLPMVRGPCDNYMQSWYFNAIRKTCEFFWYGGCEGNANRFDTEEECKKACISSPSKGKDVCQLPLKPGNCNIFTKRWYYDTVSGKCKQFSYSGCGGNDNNFFTYNACWMHCGTLEPTHPGKEDDHDRCLLQKDPGPCTDQRTAWYFDSKLNTCKKFKYGGCEGNLNRFKTRKACESSCVKKIPKKSQTTVAPTSESNADVCQSPPDKGSCNEVLTRWFYDAKTKTCFQFIYNGCDGNKNRFKTQEICMNFCSKTLSTPVPNVKTKDYTCPPSNCDELQCPLSKDVKIDERGCVYCQCFNPCEIHVCSEDKRCAVEMYRTADGEVRAQPLCRLINKPGYCPTVEAKVADPYTSECTMQCRLDSDCRNNRKCCFNGCTNVCMDPVSEVVDPGHSFDLPTQQDITVKVGEPVFLVCPANPGMSYHWSRNNASLPDDDPHIQILHNGTVYISSVEESDLSTFICTTPSSSGNHIQHKFNLLVQVPAKILPGPTLVFVQVAQPTILECRAIGSPQPIVTWWKEQKLLPTSSTHYQQNPDYSLLIKSVVYSDAGIYTCQAYNGIGSMAIHVISVQFSHAASDINDPLDHDNKKDDDVPHYDNVEGDKHNGKQPDYSEFTSLVPPLKGISYSTTNDVTPVSASQPPSPIVYKTKIIGGPIFYMKSGDTFNLTCMLTQGSSMPPTFIFWYHNGNIISYESGGGFNILTTKTEQQTHSTLFKIKAYPTDSGNYTCSPSNGEEASVIVHISSADLSVEIIEVTPSPKIGSLVQLDCIASGPPSLIVKWYFNNSFVHEDERIRILPNNTLVVSDIQISHSGHYKCVAKDNETEASASVTIIVKGDVPEDCIDGPGFSNCELLVKANYCNNRVFGSICCRSCTLAGQPPPRS